MPVESQRQPVEHCCASLKAADSAKDVKRGRMRLVQVVRLGAAGIRKQIRMQAAGRKIGSRKRDRIWRILVGISFTVHISIVIPSNSLRRMTALINDTQHRHGATQGAASKFVPRTLRAGTLIM